MPGDDGRAAKHEGGPAGAIGSELCSQSSWCSWTVVAKQTP